MGTGLSVRLCGVLLGVLLISILVSAKASFAKNEDPDPRVFAPDSTPFGKKLGEWTAEWWKWFNSMPTDQNPINDQTGEKCATKQSGSVWMLLGSGGGKAERTCIVPAGKMILIPNITTHCSFALNPSVKTEDELLACPKNDQDQTTQTNSTLDGANLPNYRVGSSVFDVAYPANNVFSVPEGTTRAASDGYWVMLTPLPPGKHELHVVGVLVEVSGPSTFIEDSRYHLIIEEPTFNVFEEGVRLGNESASVALSSPSNVTNFNLDEEAKRVSFKVSGDNVTEGVVTLPVDKLLKGPYTVTMDGTPTTDFATYRNQKTGNTDMQVIYEPGTRYITITGIEVVPEFPYSIVLLLGLMSVIVILGSAKLGSNAIFHRGN